MMTASYLAVALIEVFHSFLKVILRKNLARSESLRLPAAMAVFRRATLSLLFPCGIRLDSTLPQLILLLGVNFNREAKCLAVGNLLKPLDSIAQDGS